MQFLSSQKGMLKRNELVSHLIPPRMRDFSIEFFWNEKKNDQNFFAFFPDYYKTSVPDREFFYNVR